MHREFFSVGVSISPLALDGPPEPGPREGPMSIGGARRQTQRVGDFRNGHADKIAELDYRGRHGICGGERVQGVVNGQDFRGGGAYFDRIVKLFARRIAAARRLALRRDLSMRIRLMASAAAPKKWARPCHCCRSDPASLSQAS